jgi:6-phosphogluconolactonase
MGGRSDNVIHVFPDFAEANRSIAQRIFELVTESRSADDRFSLVLAGGGTPRGLYRLLAEEYSERLDWSRIDLFWGDERYVPHDDPASNYGMARDELLSAIPIPDRNVFPMPTHHVTAEHAARNYEQTLRLYFEDEGSGFDLVLLGIGADGHTASLFPGSPALEEKYRWVMDSVAPATPRSRMTLTFPILNQSANIFVLASGESKSEAVACATRKEADVPRCPASGLDPVSGRLEWWLDTDAASLLSVS